LTDSQQDCGTKREIPDKSDADLREESLRQENDSHTKARSP